MLLCRHHSVTFARKGFKPLPYSYYVRCIITTNFIPKYVFWKGVGRILPYAEFGQIKYGKRVQINHITTNKKFFVTKFDILRLHFDQYRQRIRTTRYMKQSEFLEIVMPFKDKLYRLAKRLLVSSEEAEDATQEIMLKLWSNSDRIGKFRNVEAFAMTMTKNLCLDRLKSKQADHLTLVHREYSNGGTSLQGQIEARDTMALVARIIEQLPEQQRLVLQLRDVEQYGYDEISDISGMKPGAVRTALSRARKTVRERLLQEHSYGIG